MEIRIFRDDTSEVQHPKNAKKRFPQLTALLEMLFQINTEIFILVY